MKLLIIWKRVTFFSVLNALFSVSFLLYKSWEFLLMIKKYTFYFWQFKISHNFHAKKWKEKFIKNKNKIDKIKEKSVKKNKKYTLILLSSFAFSSRNILQTFVFLFHWFSSRFFSVVFLRTAFFSFFFFFWVFKKLKNEKKKKKKKKFF